MIPKKAPEQREIETLFREIEEISEDLTTYFEYYKTRQAALKDMLTRSSLN